MTVIEPNINPKLVDITFIPDGYKGIGKENLYGSVDFPDELLFPKSEWKHKIEELQENDPFYGLPGNPHPKGCFGAHYSPYVFNQAPESSCVFNATAGALMQLTCMTKGVEHLVVLSPMSGYCQVARSRHSGSYMMDALELTSTVGLLPSSTYKDQKSKFKHTFHENTPFVFSDKLPNGWEETGQLFLVLEWLRISSLEQFGSALLNQFPVVYGRNGHSIKGEDLVMKSSNFFCRSLDSYGFNNRDGTGRIYDSERMMEESGAWAGRVIKIL